jgi:SAM-dependent methyltransferase
VLAQVDDIAGLIRCPRCRGEIRVSTTDAACVLCGGAYPVVGRWPVLVDDAESVIEVDQVVRDQGRTRIDRGDGSRRRKRRHMKTVIENVEHFRRLLPNRARVLIIGGGVNEHGLDAIYTDPDLTLVAFDVYASSLTQFIADAHQIPLADGCVDGVVIQAVLEHVLEPARVVEEIHRVLSENGLVYAESAFLQHVHEGPYDFMRFTESGHRWLFRRFDRVDSGAIGGPGLSFAWSLTLLTRALLRAPKAEGVVRRASLQVARVDSHLSSAARIDGATAVYFIGRRAEVSISPTEIVAQYRGAQPWSSELSASAELPRYCGLTRK